MSSKIEVSESIAQMVTEWVETGIKLGTDWRNGLSGIIEKRLARFAAPVVEHQEPVAIVIAIGGPHDKEDRVLCELQAELPPIGTKLYGSLPAPVDSALPELAELQAAIARLNQLLSDQEMNAAALCRKLQELRVEIERLKGGQPAPVSVVLPEQCEERNSTWLRTNYAVVGKTASTRPRS
jgi:hypothetical protein